MKRINPLLPALAGIVAISMIMLITWLMRSMEASQILPTFMPVNPTFPVVSTQMPTAMFVPTQEPVVTVAPTVTSPAKTYQWRGTTVTLAAQFPEAPAEAEIYKHTAETPATVKSALEFARHLGIEGHVYKALGLPYPGSYLVSDGKQFLYIGSDQYFYYYPDKNLADSGADVEMSVAARAIEAFFQTHGLDFKYTLSPDNDPGWFRVILLTPDGLPTYFEFEESRGYLINLSPTGEIIQVQALLLNQEMQSVGKFGILSAAEAWQKFLDPNTSLGMIENTRSALPGQARFWNRSYPDNKPFTLTGILNIHTAVEPGVAPLLTLGNYVLSGKTAGLEKLAKSEANVFIEARGQLLVEAGIRTFQVVSWKQPKTTKQYLSGSLRQDGEKVIFLTGGTDYPLPDPPTDLPLPVDAATLTGFFQNGVLEWDVIGLESPFSGGSGGGTGSFAKLNLGGTPAPWPTTQPGATASGVHIFNSGKEVNQGPLTIDSVELVYYTPDPRNANMPGAMTAQTEPAWRFYGHYSNGDIFVSLIQAIRQDYLLPEPVDFNGGQ